MRTQAELDARALRIRARRDVSTVLAGAYRSAFRGRGLTFEELRDYNPGDDVRWMEWNATARLGRPIVKRMREERDIVLALLVDVSPSLQFGFGAETKLAAACRAAGALAAAAVLAQDRVALLTFDERPRAPLRPAAGPLQLERVFRALGAASATDDSQSEPPRRTDAGAALDWAVRTLPRHTVTVLISDLLFSDPGAPLRNATRKHEVIALHVRDPSDELPPGMVPVRVAPTEDGHRGLLRGRWRPGQVGVARPDLAPPLLRSLGVDLGTLWTGARLIPSLHRFFEERARRAA